MRQFTPMEDEKNKWERILFWSMIILLIDGIIGLIPPLFALSHSIDLELITGLRIQFLTIAVITGFLLIYMRLKCK